MEKLSWRIVRTLSKWVGRPERIVIFLLSLLILGILLLAVGFLCELNRLMYLGITFEFIGFLSAPVLPFLGGKYAGAGSARQGKE